MPLSDGMNARPVIEIDAAASREHIFKFDAQWCGGNFDPVQSKSPPRGGLARAPE